MTKAAKAVVKREDEGQEIAAVQQGDAIIQMIERAARDPQVDIEKMERLWTMKREAEKDRARTAYLAALAAMQPNLPAVERKGKGHNSTKYARFEDFIEAIKPHLAEHGFSLTFRIKHEGATIRIFGVLGHAAGHQEETDLPLPADATGNKNAVQSWGSSISYGKRYVGLTLLGIATEDEDDDGKRGGGKPVETITEEQAAALKKLMEKANVEEQIIFEHFKVETLAGLTPEQLKTATNKINKKLEMMR